MDSKPEYLNIKLGSYTFTENNYRFGIVHTYDSKKAYLDCTFCSIPIVDGDEFDFLLPFNPPRADADLELVWNHGVAEYSSEKNKWIIKDTDFPLENLIVVLYE